jgi:Fur family ferric uptake transcriptional regulator
MESAVRDRIYEFIQVSGLRRTAQRDAIIEAAFSHTDHYTAEELLLRARAIESSVSRATVYRTLPLLVESGLLKELDLGKGQMLYDPNYIDHPRHSHLICLDCNRIVEFEDRNIDTLENCITRRLGFSAAKKLTRIEANCDEFQRSGSCSHKDSEKAESAPLKKAVFGV